ncbi:lytic transglycosylase domain-containing protein [Paracoccaceae bacterium GXU_MW_L88]
MRRLLILVFCLFGADQAAGSPNICYDAARAASGHVPAEVLAAITITETGRNGQPWPWTVNLEGKGHWFDTRDAALAFARKARAAGRTSFDVGCFQVNYRWHGEYFASLEDMFEPRVNAAYASKFLGDLFNETGSWSAAAGAYHSRTPKYANIYRARFDRIIAQLDLPAQSYQPAAAPSGLLTTAPRRDRIPQASQGLLGLARGPLIQAAGQSLF